MACVTLKRSLDHDPAAVAATTKRRRFHCGGSRSPQLANSAAASGSAASGSAGAGGSSGNSSLTFVPPPAAPSSSECGGAGAAAASVDFPASRLPPELLSRRLTAEVRRLQRRRLLPTSPPASPISSGQSATVFRGKSPESDAEMSAGGSTSCAQCAAKSASSGTAPATSEPVLFTLSQVQSIAEKLLGEREQQVRTEFQALLSAKLQEQYDAFLRFNHDQIYRMHSCAPMSYVS